MHPITRDNFEEWLHHPVTKRVFAKLKEEREDMKEGLVSKNYEQEDIAIGRCQAIALILDMTYEGVFSNE